jgi:hypothetical protein
MYDRKQEAPYIDLITDVYHPLHGCRHGENKRFKVSLSLKRILSRVPNDQRQKVKRFLPLRLKLFLRKYLRP